MATVNLTPRYFLKTREKVPPHLSFQMATSLSFATINPSQPKSGHHCVIFRPSGGRQINRIRCAGTDRTDNSSNKTESEGQNALLKIAWYGSELLGIAASVLRPPSSTVQSLEKDNKLKIDESGAVDRATVLEIIKGDFARSYFVTGLANTHRIYY